MGLLTWIIIGGLAGWVAGMLVKGKGFGLIGNVVIGIIGAFLGGWLAGAVLGIPDPLTGFNLSTFVVALLGAIILLYVAKMLKFR